MPKSGIYDDMVQIPCLVELREKLISLGYLNGDSELSRTARNLLTKAVDNEIAALDTTRRRQFESILISVKATTVIRRQQRQERAMRTANRQADSE